MSEKLPFIDFFQMQRAPFSPGIAVDRLNHTTMFDEAVARLEYAAQNNLFAVLSGPPGCGKSTALHALSSKLDPERYRVLYISESNLTPRWLYTVPLRKLGIEPRYFANDVKRQFHEALMTETRVRHKRIVMIIDEAHLITGRHQHETLEEIRFLLNCDFDSGNPLSLILSGQTELWNMLGLESSAAIAQRIDVTSKLLPLTDAGEVAGYIRTHLDYAGGSLDLFSSEAVALIAGKSGGIPRIVNKICLHCLLHAAVYDKKQITEGTVIEVLDHELPKAILRT